MGGMCNLNTSESKKFVDASAFNYAHLYTGERIHVEAISIMLSATCSFSVCCMIYNSGEAGRIPTIETAPQIRLHSDPEDGFS